MQYEVSVGVTYDGWLKDFENAMNKKIENVLFCIHKTHNNNVASINALESWWAAAVGKENTSVFM